MSFTSTTADVRTPTERNATPDSAPVAMQEYSNAATRLLASYYFARHNHPHCHMGGSDVHGTEIQGGPPPPKKSTRHSDGENFILTLIYTWHWVAHGTHQTPTWSRLTFQHLSHFDIKA